MHIKNTLLILFSTILIAGTPSTHTMEPNELIANEFNDAAFIISTASRTPVRQLTKNQKKRLEKEIAKASAHNKNLVLIAHKDILTLLLSCCQNYDKSPITSLRTSIATFLALSGTCKDFNQKLSTQIISKLCKSYPLDIRRTALNDLAGITYIIDYNLKRLPMRILVLSGVSANSRDEREISLLEASAYSNDIQFVKILFQNHADPAIKSYLLKPLVFYARSLEMAQLLVNNGANIDASDIKYPNILWKVAHIKGPSQFIDFYLNHHVCPHDIDSKGNCILHKLVKPSPFTWKNKYLITNMDDFLRSGRILIEQIPTLINTINNKNQTALDCALQSHKEAEKNHGSYTAFAECIKLLKKHGALRAKDLNAHI